MNVMIKFNEVTRKNRPKHNPKLPQITNGYKLIHDKAGSFWLLRIYASRNISISKEFIRMLV